MTAIRPAPRTQHETPDRRYRDAATYLGHKTAALTAITHAARDLQEAHTGIASFNPSITRLEKAKADIEIALREARGMANLDDAAPVSRDEIAARRGEVA